MSIIYFFLIIFSLFLIIYLVLALMNRNRLYRVWNESIASECDHQNETDRISKDITSLQSAWICQNEEVRSTHLSLILLHEQILNKISEYFKTMYECAEDITSQPKRGGIRYFPFVINGERHPFMNNFGLENLRTEAINLGLLVIEPGTTTQWKEGTSRGFYRYHYPLKLPKGGEFGLYLKEKRPEGVLEKEDSTVQRIKWKEKQGIVWDPTINHHLSNQSNESCYVIIADIPREFTLKKQIINYLLHKYFPPNN